MRSRRLPAAATAAVLGLALLAALPIAAQATIAESDSFDGWTTTVSGQPEFTVSADTSQSHDGAASARIDFDSAYSAEYVDLRQSIRANGGTTYAMSAWVRTDQLSSTGAAYFVLSGDHSQRVEFPAGTSDWTKLEWTYTQPAGSMTFVMRALVRGGGTVWIDDVRMVAQGGEADLVINGSFEEHDPPPGTLAFSDTALVYDAGAASVGVATVGAAVQWDVRASSGQRVDSGQETVAAGETSIDLSALPVGYYRITMSIDQPVAATRSASLVIVDPAGADAAGSPVGLAVHVNRYTVDQVDSLMAPLGAGALREGPSWDTVETAPGVYAFPALFDQQIAAAKARGERPLVILAYFSRWYDDGKTPSSPEGIQAFADYAATAAEHYGPDVDYEIYNEFNHSFNTGACGTTAACYEQLLEPASAAIHAAAPGARVVGPVLAGADWTFFEELFALGGLEHLDVVSYHTYDFPVAPEGKTEAGVERLRDLIDEYAPGADIPIWLSEHGWPTTTGGTTEDAQAAYYLRSAALLEAAGVERTIFYELIDSGANPSEQEHNFGIARRAIDGGTALTPKPAYAALATYNRLVGGLELTGLERLAGVTVATYSGATAAETVRMMWAPSGTGVVRSEIGASARLINTDGREWRVRPNGPLELSLTGDPVFVVGDSGAPSVVEHAATTVAAPEEIPVGTAVDVPVTVTAAPVDASGSLTIAGPVGAAAPLAASGGSFSGTLTLAPLRDRGLVPLSYTIREGDGVIAFVDSQAEVVDDPLLSFGPVELDGSLTHALEVRNLDGGGAVTLDDISWSVGGSQGQTAPVTVADGDAVEVPVAFTGVADWTPVAYSIDTTIGGAVRSLRGTTVSAPILADVDSDTAESVSMRNHGGYVAIAGATPDAADLDPEFTLTWSDEGLRIRVSVQDEDHVPAATVDRLWSGDSVQFAVAKGLPGDDPASRVEFGAFLGGAGSDLYRYTLPVGTDTDATADVVRAGTVTTYDIVAPWSELGVDPDAGAFSFSLLVNDNDGGVRQGFFEWGSGIGPSKNAALFLPVVPMPSSAAAAP